jgi:hypothetical protein
MVAEIIKYKHYLLILAALLLANYVVVPLDEWKTEQELNWQLVNKQYDKTQSLINNKKQLSEHLEASQKNLLKIDQVFFVNSSEDKFKLMAQSTIEKSLAIGNCQIERIGFKGSAAVSANIQRWAMEVRYKGDINCMTSTTRSIESLSPYVKIENYNFSHRSLTQDVQGKFTARVQLNVWYKEEK